jgi:hypothetical protein
MNVLLGQKIQYVDKTGICKEASIVDFEIILDSTKPFYSIFTKEIPVELLSHDSVIVHLDTGKWICGHEVVSTFGISEPITA